MTFWIALALVLLHVVSGWWALALLVGAAVFEISQTGFWLWRTTRHRAQVGAETMVGRVVEVAQECRPVGYVRVQGELWRARCDDGARPGERVRVTGRDGLLLTVSREPAPS
jgi:membrane protein implicated in regulation of membrane protease activity